MVPLRLVGRLAARLAVAIKLTRKSEAADDVIERLHFGCSCDFCRDSQYSNDVAVQQYNASKANVAAYVQILGTNIVQALLP